MKKIFLYSLMMLVSMVFVGCSDDDSTSSGADNRMFMTMFRKNDNTNLSSSDPYNCRVEDLNKVRLYWYTVNGAYGYEIKYTANRGVTSGKEGWEAADTTNSVKHVVIVGAENYSYLVENLNYQTEYRFAIRVLHSADLNDPQNSNWYGYGDGRQWEDWIGMTTAARYNVPSVLQVSDITKTSMRINLNRDISTMGVTQDLLDEYREHFTMTDGANGNICKVDYLTITPSFSSPNATVPAEYTKDDVNGVKCYKIEDADWQRGYIDVVGLSENSVYNIDVWDADKIITVGSEKVNVDACYNSLLKRTKGTPGPAILIPHVAERYDTTGIGTENETLYDISQYNASKLDLVLENYLTSTVMAENQVFYLEGGKAYYFSGNQQLYKGVTFQTNPQDFNPETGEGKRAILYLNGLYKQGTTPRTCNFMLGRTPEAGENATIPIDIDTIRFIGLDVQVPQAYNYGHQYEGIGNAHGNYFMNMYSNGMGINVTHLEWNNCTFQGLIRGFFRVQGSNDFNIHKMILKNCEFYNMGHYRESGGDYCYLFGDHGSKPKSNIFEDVEVTGNVFYNSPKSPLITDNGRNVTWHEDTKWTINVHHNTFVNFNTIVAKQHIMNLRYIPAGSDIAFTDNLIIVTKDPNDVYRKLESSGFYIDKIQGGNGTGTATFKIKGNMSTNDNLVNGQVFGTNPMSATTSNAVGKFYKQWDQDAATNVEDYFPYGKDGLIVEADGISAVDLMVSPNPEFFRKSAEAASPNDFRTTKGIDGLYYKTTPEVQASKIYTSGVGAPKLRNGK